MTRRHRLLNTGRWFGCNAVIKTKPSFILEEGVSHLPAAKHGARKPKKKSVGHAILRREEKIEADKLVT